MASSSSRKKEPILREMVEFGHNALLEAEEYEEHRVGNLFARSRGARLVRLVGPSFSR